ERPQTVGKLREFWGNFGMFVRAWALIREYGPEGVAQTGKLAVLNANYLRKLLEGTYNLPYETDSLHEVVFDDGLQKASGVTTMDVAKRLIDHGFHPPTIYFPLVVHGAIMIEPTETESKANLDQFITALRSIAERARAGDEALKAAPVHAPRRRLDETLAARKPILAYQTPAPDGVSAAPVVGGG
ncbi:MAG: aminomethyl-transferring glycine dehydrogenase subunit GcvPB, partial [Sphingomicrobium sp.]